MKLHWSPARSSSIESRVTKRLPQALIVLSVSSLTILLYCASTDAEHARGFVAACHHRKDREAKPYRDSYALQIRTICGFTLGSFPKYTGRIDRTSPLGFHLPFLANIGTGWLERGFSSPPPGNLVRSRFENRAEHGSFTCVKLLGVMFVRSLFRPSPARISTVANGTRTHADPRRTLTGHAPPLYCSRADLEIFC
jgi:hypothetical protein